MAAKTFYATNSKASVYQELSETDPGTEAYASPVTGWIGSTGSTNRSEFRPQTERASSTFDATTYPDGSLDTSNGDGFRTTNTYTGTFDSGNWVFHFCVRSNTNTGCSGKVHVRIFRSTNANGSSATEITSGDNAGTTVTSLASSVTQDSSVTVNPGSVTLTNEYLFFQVAWERTGGGGMTSSDIDMRVGNASSNGTRVVTPNFTGSYTLATSYGSFAVGPPAQTPDAIVGSDCAGYFGDSYSAGTWTKSATSDSSTDNFAQSTAGQRPTTATSASGATELVFDAVDDQVNSLGMGLFPSTYGGIYCAAFVLYVTSFNNANNDSAIFFTGGTSNTLITGTGGSGSNGNFSMGGAQANTALSLNTYYRVICIATNGNVKLYLNGTLQTTQGGATDYLHELRLGGPGVELGNHGAAVPFGGRIGSLLFAHNSSSFSWSVADLDAALLARIEAGHSSAAATLSIGMSASQASYVLTGIDATLSTTAHGGSTMAASQASFVVTGIAAALTKQSKIAAAQASYLLTGVDANLLAGRKVIAAQASFIETGVAASLIKTSKIVAAQTSYVVTGVAAGLAAGRKVTAAQASYAVTGISAALTKQSKVIAAQASYVLTGVSASLIKASKLTAAQASYVVTGVSATLTKSTAQSMAAAQATYLLTGVSAGLLKQSKISAAQASYLLTGVSANLLAGRKVTAVQASYVLTGVSAALSKTSKIVAAQASYVLTGVAANLLAGRKISAAQASYSVTGVAASLTKQSKIIAAQATYQLTGIAAGLSKTNSNSLVAAQASFVVTGVAASLAKTSRITAAQATYQLTGVAATIGAGRKISAAQASFVVTGISAAFSKTTRLAAGQASYVVTGVSAALTKASKLSAAQATFIVTGIAAGLLRGRKLTAAQASYSLTGNAATLTTQRIIVATQSSFTVTGNDVTFHGNAHTFSIETGYFNLVFFDVPLAYQPIIPPAVVDIELDQIEPLVRVDILHVGPLVRFDQREIVSLVHIASRVYAEDSMSLRVGAVAVIPIITRVLGTKADVDTLQIAVTTPSGTTTTYVLGTDSAVESVATGEYRARVTCSERGTWSYVWTTGGTTVGVESGQFLVDPVS
jgi:hypothetical protein